MEINIPPSGNSMLEANLSKISNIVNPPRVKSFKGPKDSVQKIRGSETAKRK